MKPTTEWEGRAIKQIIKKISDNNYAISDEGETVRASDPEETNLNKKGLDEDGRTSIPGREKCKDPGKGKTGYSNGCK